MKLEKEIENKVRTWAEERGWVALKFTPWGSRGWPDRCFISPTGNHVWVEFKRPLEAPTRLQDYRLEQMRLRGVNCYWVDDYEIAIRMLEKHE